MRLKDISELFPEFEPRNRCCLAAAVLGAGALSAGASIVGSQSAASAQRDAAADPAGVADGLAPTVSVVVGVCEMEGVGVALGSDELAHSLPAPGPPPAMPPPQLADEPT